MIATNELIERRLNVQKYNNKCRFESGYICDDITTDETKNVVVNGSVAVLIPKEDIHLTEKQMEYFSSDEYRKFYQIARNYQTRSLNVDATSVFFYGVLKECCNG